MKRIIHLSDLHIGDVSCTAHFQKVVTSIRAKVTHPEEYVIVVSGDLVDYVDDEQRTYHLAKQHLDELESVGFTVLVTPGNCDYWTGSKIEKKYDKHFKQVFYGDTDISYPKKDIIDGVAFLALDSMEGKTKKDSPIGTGCLGKKQLKRLKKILATPEVLAAKKVVVYLHHQPFRHPIPDRLLQDREEFKEILFGKVDALLFGHTHESNSFHGKERIPRVYDGGTSTKKEGKISPHMIIDLSGDPADDIDGGFLA